MRITQCQLHNVACFEELTLDFPEGTDPEKADTYLFVGTNGTGKSTILMSLAQAFAIYDTGIGRRLRDVDGYATVMMSSGEWGGHRILRREGTRPTWVRGHWPPGADGALAWSLLRP